MPRPARRQQIATRIPTSAMTRKRAMCVGERESARPHTIEGYCLGSFQTCVLVPLADVTCA